MYKRLSGGLEYGCEGGVGDRPKPHFFRESKFILLTGIYIYLNEKFMLLQL